MINTLEIENMTGQTAAAVKEEIEGILQRDGFCVRDDFEEVVSFFKCWKEEDPDEEPFDASGIYNDDWEEHDYYDKDGVHYKIRIDYYYYCDPGVPAEDYVYVVSVY